MYSAKEFIVCYGLVVPEKIDASILGDTLCLVDRRMRKFNVDEIMKLERK